MATPIRLCTYTIHGFNDTKVDYIQHIVNTHDIILLQEHWLFESQCHIIQDKITDISSHCISGMNDECLKAGRGYGGCAILWKSSLACTIEPVHINNRRICAVKINLQGVSIFLCCVYMPCDTLYDSYSAEIYTEVFNDIFNNDICNRVNHIIIGGDFNTDLSRVKSSHTKSFIDSCSREGMKHILKHPKCNIDYTYMSMSNHHKSCIDHFIMSDNLFESVEHCSVLHDGDNLSDHDVVSLQLTVNIVHDVINTEFVCKPLWWKATEHQLNAYKRKLDALLSKIVLPVDAINCKNLFCHSHREVIQSYHDAIICSCIQASSCIPSSKPKIGDKRIPGWTEHVKNYKERAIFWHKLWKDNGSPGNGVLFDIRRKTRWEYHRMLKIVKSNKEAISADRMAKGVSGYGFWSEVKKTMGHSNSLTSTVDGVQGSEEIAKLFQEKYNNLYNSVAYDSQQMAALRREIDEEIRNIPLERYDRLCEFSADDIEDKIVLIKPGKGGGQSGHSSDHIINGSRKLFCHIAYLFNCMLSHGFAPEDFRLSTLIPIPKNNRKSLNVSNNYRAIALSSIMGKLLDHLLLFKFQDVFMTSDLQYGFKKKHGTTHCTFIVNEIIKYYVNSDSDVYVTLLDASRAFDRVNYVKLFRILVKRKLCPVVTRFLLMLYTNQNIRVKWGSCISSLCNVSNGVKQGGVMSPILFTIYIDELLNRLSIERLGCHIGHLFCGAFGYADDVIILAPTLFSLRRMLKICSDFAYEYNVIFNSSKSKLLFFGNVRHRPAVSPITFCGSTIELVSHDKHLGNVIGQDSCKIQIQQNINEFNRKVNMVNTHFHHVQFDVLYQVFKTYCMPLYGSQLWDHGTKYADKFNTNWRKAIRKIFNLPNRTHCDLLPYICDDDLPAVQLYFRIISFCRSLVNSSNEISRICYNLAISGSGSAVSNNMSVVSSFYAVPREYIYKITRNCSAVNVVHTESNIIKASIIRDLLYMRCNNKYYVHNEQLLSAEEIEYMLVLLCTE